MFPEEITKFATLAGAALLNSTATLAALQSRVAQIGAFFTTDSGHAALSRVQLGQCCGEGRNKEV